MTMANEVVTLGELLLRLSPESYYRIGQSQKYMSYYGGGEANVAVSLSHLGHKCAYVSKVPSNALGEGGIGFLKSHSVDTSFIVRDNGMQGIYFLESGFGGRPGSAVYNRKGSSATKMKPSDFDWDAIFDGAKWFHISGIALSLSDSAQETVLLAIKEAKKHGLIVSFDFNYRPLNLPMDKAREIYPLVMPHVDVLFAASFDFQEILGFSKKLSHADLFNAVRAKYGCTYIFGKHRHVVSANEQVLRAYVYGPKGFASTPDQSFRIFDRIGAGDAFAAGVIHKLLLDYEDVEGALTFGLTNCILKQTLAGDVSTFSAEDIDAFIADGGHSEVKR